MTDTIISISIPYNVYATLKMMAAKDRRSARNYITKVLVEHVPPGMLLKVEKPIAKPKQICKKCNVTVDYEPAVFTTFREMCAECFKTVPISGLPISELR